MKTLNELAADCYEISMKREKNGANVHNTPLGLLKHTATEVVEATDAFYSDDINDFEEELADIIVCVLILCRIKHVDIDKVLAAKIEKNRRRAEGTGDKL